MLDIPNCKMLSTLGARARLSVAPKLWNSFPRKISHIQSLSVFKRIVKTHLFRPALTCGRSVDCGFYFLSFYIFYPPKAHLIIFYEVCAIQILIIFIYYYSENITLKNLRRATRSAT